MASRQQRTVEQLVAAAFADPLPIGREEQMLDQLESIFLRKGFRSVTVDQLARELRCSKRSLYELASSKEALFLRVFDRYLSRLREKGLRGAMAAEPVDALEPYIAPAIEAARKLSATLLQDMAAYPPAKELWERHTSERMAGLRRLVQRCVDEGHFREVNTFLVAEVVASSVRRISEPKFLSASKLTYRQAVEELYGLLLHGLRHRPDNGSTKR